MKKQIFVDDEYMYDYNIIDDNVHTLYYSNNEFWSDHVRGQEAMQIIDDGDGLIPQFQLKTLEYGDAEKLLILLKLINEPIVYEIGTKKVF
tara:strand:- start:749 stop:1021 length:273 start_codon:yes stop_codon:yes gene_type:complete